MISRMPKHPQNEDGIGVVRLDSAAGSVWEIHKMKLNFLGQVYRKGLERAIREHKASLAGRELLSDIEECMPLYGLFGLLVSLRVLAGLLMCWSCDLKVQRAVLAHNHWGYDCRVFPSLILSCSACQGGQKQNWDVTVSEKC